ncbi:MAG: pentapeptide repeat-containing protein [Parabacteroides sp.]
MLGLHFDDCNQFGFSISFNHCILNHTSFYKTKLKNISFIDSQLREVDFSACDLSHALFSNCDLASATFDHTNMEGADFRTAFHYSIDPENNRVKKAKFFIMGLPELLEKYDLKIE